MYLADSRRKDKRQIVRGGGHTWEEDGGEVDKEQTARARARDLEKLSMRHSTRALRAQLQTSRRPQLGASDKDKDYQSKVSDMEIASVIAGSS